MGSQEIALSYSHRRILSFSQAREELMNPTYMTGAMMAFGVASFISLAAGNITLGIATLCFLIFAYRNRDALTVDKTYYRAIGFFLATMLLSALACGHVGQGLKMWGDFWIWRLMPFFIVTLAVKAEGAKRVLIAASLGLAISMGYAIVEGLGGEGRASGFYGHPMTLAGWLCLYVPLFLVALFERSLSLRLRQGAGALFAISLVALLFNGTRGAWLAIAGAVGLLMLYFLLQKRKLAILVTCLLIAAGVGLSQYEPFMQRLDTITAAQNTERFLMWESAYHMFQDHPVLGVGLSQYKDNYQQKYISPEAKEPELAHAHNNFMQMLAENGIVGFAGFLTLLAAFIGVSLYRFWKYKNPYALAMAMGTLALVVQGLTEYNFGNSAVMKCFWLTEGGLLVMARSWENKG